MHSTSNPIAWVCGWPRLCVRMAGAVLLACTGLATAAPAEVRRAPIPDWVQRIAPAEPTTAPPQQVSQGVYHLLADTQTRVDAHSRTVWRHLATQALNARGVENVAHVEVRFDPSYQQLALHMLQVRRGARVIPKLATASVKVLQREQELEYLIFDGSKTANIFLDDIRVGDVVEYAYSLRGSNPVFEQRQFGRLDLRFGVPIQHVHTRLLWPRGRPVQLMLRNGAAPASVTERGSHLDHVWQAHQVEALAVESDAPNWFDPYPSVLWSEFDSWQSVAQWALPLYQPPRQLSPALQAEVERIARVHATPTERMLAALRFVQSEIRYLGVEIGAGSHAPSAPERVLERRFGDCKDKSLLTMTLLQALGIDARAALVNTSTRRGIGELLPMPYAFNHVIVQATLDGRHYWLDPTRAAQPGDLAHLYQPDYGLALIVDAGSRSLVPMANDSHQRLGERKVHTTFDAQGGYDAPVRYTVTTVAQGADAEAMRSTLASQNRDDLQKNYLNFYARYYPELSVAAPMTVQEDAARNRITLTEHYLIPRFWVRNNERKRHEAAIHVPEVDQYLRSPQQTIRTGPLALAHPVRLTHTTEVKLPSAWNLAAEEQRVEDPSFEFHRRRTEHSRVLTLVDTFRSRADHVLASDTARYAANLGKARDAVDLVLFHHDAAGIAATNGGLMARFNWPVAMLAALLLAGCSWLALKVFRHDPLPRPGPTDPSLKGIGGWLLLPALGVIVMPIRLLTDMAGLLPAYAVEQWALLTTAGTQHYHALWAPVLLFELAANILYLVWAVLLAVMFFQKRRAVPRLYIALLVYMVVIQLVDLALLQSIPAAAEATDTKADMKELTRSVVALLVWGSYFGVSKRVRATFVETRRPPPRPAFAPTQPLAPETAH